MDSPDFLTRLSRRAVISITGPEARDFLQRVVTHGPQGTEPGRAMASALLTPQGKVLADLVFFDNDADGLFVDVPAGEAESLLKRFTLYRLRAKAELALRTDLAVAAANGTSGTAQLEHTALSAAPDPRDPRLGIRAIIADAASLPDATEYHDRARASCIVPELGADYGPGEYFSSDVNHDLNHAINYRKGCFVGQEVASRMHRKGGVRKRTARLTAEAPLTPGTAVLGGEVPLGEVLGVYGLDALCMIRVDRLEQALADGMALTANGMHAQINLPHGT